MSEVAATRRVQASQVRMKKRSNLFSWCCGFRCQSDCKYTPQLNLEHISNKPLCLENISRKSRRRESLQNKSRTSLEELSIWSPKLQFSKRSSKHMSPEYLHEFRVYSMHGMNNLAKSSNNDRLIRPTSKTYRTNLALISNSLQIRYEVLKILVSRIFFIV